LKGDSFSDRPTFSRELVSKKKITIMKNSFLFATLIILAVSCKENITPAGEKTALTGLGDSSYVIFGTYYGFCENDCAQYYKLTDGALYEDKNRNPPFENPDFSFIKLDDDKFQVAKILAENFPSNLYSEDTIVGCPDCADGGGIYIEVKTQTGKQHWFIDTNTSQIPEYLHDFVADVQETIKELR
jgi:hypothetical protein